LRGLYVQVGEGQRLASASAACSRNRCAPPGSRDGRRGRRTWNIQGKAWR
jgi:hypothetical protein